MNHLKMTPQFLLLTIAGAASLRLRSLNRVQV